MKHIDPSFYPAPHAVLPGFDDNEWTVVLVTISRVQGEDAIERIRSALPESDIVNLSQRHIERNLRDTMPPAPFSLTHRQQEILDYLLHGMSNKEIGRKLGLSHFTVRNHVSNILRILNFPCRREMRRSLNTHHAAPAYPTALVA